MTTPTIRTQTPVRGPDFPNISILLYGEPKVGKTTTAAAFPHPLILNVLAENGTQHLAGDVTDIAGPANLLEIVRWFKTAKHDYQTIVLDGLTTLVLDAIARANSKDTRQAVKEATAELRAPLHEFLSLPSIRVITGHARKDEEEIYVEHRRQIKISVYPDLPPRLRQLIEGRVDAFGYCFHSNGKSQIWWLPLDTEAPKPRSIAAGNRVGLPKMTDLSYQALHAALTSPAA